MIQLSHADLTAAIGVGELEAAQVLAVLVEGAWFRCIAHGVDIITPCGSVKRVDTIVAEGCDEFIPLRLLSRLAFSRGWQNLAEALINANGPVLVQFPIVADLTPPLSEVPIELLVLVVGEHFAELGTTRLIARLVPAG